MPLNPQRKIPQNKFIKIAKDYAIYANIGITLVVSVLFWFFLGTWLDKKLNTSPLFLVIGIFLAFVSIFYEIVKFVKISEKNEKK